MTMPRMNPAAETPFTKWGNARAKPKPAVPKHDPLCVTVSGLSYCWCKCSKCWDPMQRRCVCSSCHCYRAASRTA